jgi:hypothetical protein
MNHCRRVRVVLAENRWFCICWSSAPRAAMAARECSHPVAMPVSLGGPDAQRCSSPGKGP